MSEKVKLIIKLESIAMNEGNWKALDCFQAMSGNTKSEIILGGILSRGIRAAVEDMEEGSVDRIKAKFDLSEKDVETVDKIVRETGNINSLFDIKI